MKVLVVGCTSGVGLQVVRHFLSAGEGYDVRVLVRNQYRASRAVGYGAHRLQYAHGDLTRVETLPAACRGMDAVVCCAGARDGWRVPWGNRQSPKKVDAQGVENLASAAQAEGVRRFVLVSCLGVTRRWWLPSALMDCCYGRVLHWKLKGEDAVRDLFGGRADRGYFVVRPGGLNNEDGGKRGIVARQGDHMSGYISRSDVASVVVGCAIGLAPLTNVTFEIVNSPHDTDAPPEDMADCLALLRPDVDQVPVAVPETVPVIVPGPAQLSKEKEKVIEEMPCDNVPSGFTAYTEHPSTQPLLASRSGDNEE